MEEQTLKELKEELVELGMPEEDADEFRTKSAAIATINALKTTKIKAELPENDDKVESIEEKPDPVEDRETNKAWKDKATRMKAKLLAQEFVSILVPLEPEEKIGEVVWVSQDTEEIIPLKDWLKLPHASKMRTYQKRLSGEIISPQLNGYRYFIPKGVYYQVPMQIFEVVNEANMEQLKATQYKNLERIDPKTGVPYKDSF